MGKRSQFERRARDFYRTPAEAVRPLIPHLPTCDFAEPCAGDGALIDALEVLTKRRARCVWKADIEPQRADITQRDFTALENDDGLAMADLIITNPPWDWSAFSAIADAARAWRIPAWFLLPADYAHNARVSPLMARCQAIVSVGRVKWIADSPATGKENCAWYFFLPHPVAVTTFIPRQAKEAA